MLCFAEERKVRVENGRCQQRDELFEEASTIHSVLNLVVLVDKDDGPLHAGIYVSIRDFFNRILKEIVASNLDLFSLLPVMVLLLYLLAKEAEELGPDLEVIDPGNVAHKILSYNVWNIAEGHLCTVTL